MLKQQHGLHVFSISLLAVVGLMVFGVSGVQASEFTVNGKTLKELGLSERLVLTLDDAVADDLLIVYDIPVLNFIVHCQDLHIHYDLLKNGQEHFHATLSGCFSPESEATCEIPTFELSGTGQVDSTAMFIDFTPPAGKPFGKLIVHNKGGEECLAISPGEVEEEMQLTGTMSALISGDTLAFSEAIQKTRKAKLLYGTRESFLSTENSKETLTTLLLEGQKGELIGAKA